MPRSHLEINFPKPINIMARSSSITNAFINGIVPNISPTIVEIEKALSILEVDPLDVRCAYCGDEATEWDHLNPLIVKTAGTGFITEIANLVPSCPRCNQSKGNKKWKEWIRGKARLSPSNRKVADLERRIELLERYESGFVPTKLELAKYVPLEKWERYQKARLNLLAYMKEANVLAAEIRNDIRDGIEVEKKRSAVAVSE
jgi:hypothetical protein